MKYTLINRVVHALVQGTAEWHAHRRHHFNASEAPAMLGVSQYQARSKLLDEKVTGITPEISAHLQGLFDDGHTFEAQARPWAEEILGEDLYPSVVSVECDGLPLSASFDGITAGDDIIFEHKTLNQALAESLPRGVIPDSYRPQLEQQLLISGAEKCLFMASNGNPETMVYAWYVSEAVLRARLIEAWKQFAADMKDYKPVEVIPAAVAAPIKDLPAVVYRLNGLALTSNLADFKVAAAKLVEDSKKELVTDQDFVDQDALNKAFEKAEANIELVKAQVVGEIVDVDKFCRDMSEIGELIRQARLAGEKKVTARKAAIKLEVVQRGQREFAEHIAALNARIGKPYMPTVPNDFPGVIKSLRTVESLNNAVNTELARAKIAASAIADRIAVNLKYLELNAGDFISLFPDTEQIVQKAEDDLAALVKVRIADHKEVERVKAEKAEADRKAAEVAEAAKKELEAVVPVVPVGVSPAPATITGNVAYGASSQAINTTAPPPTPLHGGTRDPDEIINAVIARMREMTIAEQTEVLNAAIAVITRRPKAKAA